MDALSTHDRVMAARIKIGHLFGYYKAALWRMELVPTNHPQIRGTMAVDKHLRWYFDPDLDWTVDNMTAVGVHEINHVLRDHPLRAENAVLTEADVELWQIAADVALNQDIVDIPSLRDHWPSPPLVPESIGCDVLNETVEFYYDWLRQNGGGHADHDCGSAAHGQDRDWELGEPTDENPGVATSQIHQIKQQVAADILAVAEDANHPQHGTVAAGLRRWAQETLNPQVRWQDAIPAHIRRACYTSAIMRVDYSYKRPNRRSSATGFVQPVLRGPDISIGVVVDTSGSVTNRGLAQALAELKTMFDRYRDVTVYSVDAAVHNAQRLTADPSKLVLLGSGGTDMMGGIRHVAKNKKHHVCVVVTDAICDWDATGPAMPVVLVVIDNPNANTPSWAITVHVETRNPVGRAA